MDRSPLLTLLASTFIAGLVAASAAQTPASPAGPSRPSTIVDAAAREKDATETGLQAVIYGLPLVMMDLTRQRMTNVSSPGGLAAPVNQFANAPIFPPASFRNVVRANVDTLYSSAFLDLSVEPLVVSVPDTGGRYYLLPMLDAWTNVFATPGTRTTGTTAASFAITGPNWSGTLPAGMREFKSPTNLAWILGRTQTNGPEDYPAVHAIQAGFQLVPLSQFGKTYAPPRGVVDASADMNTPPIDELKAMTGVEFLSRLSGLLAANPPALSDTPVVTELAKIGVIPGQHLDVSTLDPAVLKGLDGIVPAAIAALQQNARQMGRLVDGWRIPPMNMAAFGTDYRTRAVIALIAFGANLPQDALYPTAFVDGDGQPLDGAKRYVLHFAPGLTPPVRAFWSVTLYDPDSFFVDNPLHRHAISSWMKLANNADGSLDIYVQGDSPGADKEANWLPSPAGRFNVTLRMYWPTDEPPSILDGSWNPPPLTEIR